MGTPADFLQDGPTPLDSEAYMRDYTLTRMLGSAQSSVRLPSETEIGQFWTDHTGKQYTHLLNNLINGYSLTVPQSTRLMAMFWTATA